MFTSILVKPVSSIIVVLAILIAFTLLMAFLSDDDQAITDAIKYLLRPISGVGDGIFEVFKGIGTFVSNIGEGIGDAIVTAVDNVTSGATIKGIICALKGNCS